MRIDGTAIKIVLDIVETGSLTFGLEERSLECEYLKKSLQVPHLEARSDSAENLRSRLS